MVLAAKPKSIWVINPTTKNANRHMEIPTKLRINVFAIPS